MKELIDKAAVVAEIERLDNYWHLSKSPGGQAFVESLLSFLDTLEVKEVDLEEELSNYIKHYRNKETGYTMLGIAEHFFELGIKAHKGE